MRAIDVLNAVNPIGCWTDEEILRQEEDERPPVWNGFEGRDNWTEADALNALFKRLS